MASFASLCLVDYLCGLVNLKMLNPSSQNTYQLADIASIMNDELSGVVVPGLKRVQQNFFVMNVDQTIVQGQSAYTFPPRAIGNSVRDVVLVDSNGNEVALNNLEREYIKTQFPFTFVPAIWSFGMYGTANEINLYNTMIQSYTAYKLRFITERRPGALTLSTSCGQITGITGNVVSLSYVDQAWTTATTFDSINQLPPFQSFADDISISLINGFQITVSGTALSPGTGVPASLAIGQWICPAMLSCIPQIPYELFPLLTELTIATMSGGLDMSQLLAAANAKIENYAANAAALVKPRVTGSPKVIINQSSRGTGFGRGMGFR